MTATRLLYQVDALVRPATGVVHLAAEAAETGQVGHAGCGQAAHGGDQEPRPGTAAVIGGQEPCPALLLPEG